MYEELITRLKEWPRVATQYEGSVDKLHDDAYKAIEDLQTRIPKCGVWKDKIYCSNMCGYDYGMTCSVCDQFSYSLDHIPMPHYCPNCGAKMT